MRGGGDAVTPSSWPSRQARESREIAGFLEHYALLHSGRRLEIVEHRDRPDYILRDPATGAFVAVELTSVYRDDRSVPDLHMNDRALRIRYRAAAIDHYAQRVAECVRDKVQQARNGYDLTHPLILSIYANEYVSNYMNPPEWDRAVKAHKAIYDDMAPFAEVVIWPLPNRTVFRVRPRALGKKKS